MNLLFTVTRNYLPVMRVCLAFVTPFPCSEGYQVWLLHSDLTEDDVMGMQEEFRFQNTTIHARYVDPADFDAFPDNSRYPKMMYYRIFASRYLPESVDRVLYLDPDIVVLRPLSALYQLPFEQYLFYGCTHVKEVLTRLNQLRLGIEEKIPYINTGVLLMNLNGLRAILNERELLQFIERKGAVFTLPDQDIITALYGHRTGLLDTMVYNLSERVFALYNADLRNEKRDMEWVKSNTVILHYCGIDKPWKEGYKGTFGAFWREAEQLLHHTESGK